MAQPTDLRFSVLDLGAQPATQSKISNLKSKIVPVLVLAAVLIVWEGVADLRLGGLSEGTFAYKQVASTLPPVHKVLQAYAENADSFLSAGLITVGNAFIGFVIGAVVGYGLAVLMSRARWVERSFALYIVGSQMVPVIALAPTLYGIIRDETALKITVAAYLTFFPVTVNVLKGLRSIDPRALDLMHSIAASPWQTYRKLRMPASLPFLFNALKIASTGSLIGAIVSELMGGSHGVGVLMITLLYNAYGQSAKLWALVIEVAVIGLLFFAVVSLTERIVVPWQPEFRRARGGQ